MSGNHEFDEARLSEHLDPLDSQQQGPDWERIYRALGEAVDGLEATESEKLAYALKEVLLFLVSVPLGSRVVDVHRVAQSVRPFCNDGSRQAGERDFFVVRITTFVRRLRDTGECGTNLRREPIIQLWEFG